MARLGFLGTGTIAAAMVRGLAGQGHDILISPRNADMARTLAAEFEGVTLAPNDAVVAGSDVVFLCLLAKVAQQVLPAVSFRPDQTVISVMVDMPLARLRVLCAPATRIAITIPLPPISRGGCPLPVYPASPDLERLFGDRNPVLPQRSEAALNAHLAVSALCAPILDQLAAASDWLAAFAGDPAAAEAHVVAMIRAYLRPEASPGGLAAALEDLSTEGGLNAILRAAMAGARHDLRAGLDGFRARVGLDGGAEQ